MAKLLLVVDMQNDFVTGVLGSKYAQEIVPNVVKKIKEYNKNDDIVIATKDCHFDEDYLKTREGINLPIKHCLFNTNGHNLIPEINELIDIICIKVNKFGLNNFDIDEKTCTKIPKDLESIEIIGVATNMCVISCAICLQNLDQFVNTEIIIDASCCASFDPILHEKTLDVMESLQMKVINRK